MFRSLAGNICRGSTVNSSRNLLRLISPKFSTTAARRCLEQNPTEDQDQGPEKSAVRRVDFLKTDTGILIGNKASGRIFLQMCTGCTFEIEPNESDTDKYSTYKITGPNDESIQKMVTMMNTILKVSKGEPRDNEVLEYMTVHQDACRLLIGKEGRTKRMIELISGCHFSLMYEELSNNIKIIGTAENVEYAKELITRMINNSPRNSQEAEVIKTTKSNVAQIVGRGGNRIKYIQMIANCGIVINDEEGVVLVTGSPEAKKMGVELIQAIMEFSHESK